MTSLNARNLITTAVAGLVITAGPIGCGSESAPTAAPVTRTASNTRAPRESGPAAVKPVAQLMTELGIDDRVVLPEDKAPDSPAARKAVLEFFDAFARGDDRALASMLSSLDRLELEELVDSGAWAESTAGISRVEVQTGQSPEGLPCALAIFFVGDDFQPQLWYYNLDGATPVFDAVAAPPDLMDNLTGHNWIARWFQILQEEIALADKPDAEFVAQQRDISGAGEASGGTSSGTKPGSPSKPGKSRRRPPGPGGPGPGG